MVGVFFVVYFLVIWVYEPQLHTYRSGQVVVVVVVSYTYLHQPNLAP